MEFLGANILLFVVNKLVKANTDYIIVFDEITTVTQLGILHL